MTIKEITFKTKLMRAIGMYTLLSLIGVSICVIKTSTGSWICILLIILIFFQFLSSKQIFQITFIDDIVQIDYLRFRRQSITFKRDLLYTKKRKDVKFRGGVSMILELYLRDTNKKVFEINEHLLKNDCNFEILESYFSSGKV